jgi:hypothetical protein
MTPANQQQKEEKPQWMSVVTSHQKA